MNEKGNDELTLKTLREHRQLTQDEISDLLGVSRQMISYWETRRKIPRFDNAIALAAELGVSLKTLARSMGLDVTGIPDDVPIER